MMERATEGAISCSASRYIPAPWWSVARKVAETLAIRNRGPGRAVIYRTRRSDIAVRDKWS